MKVNWHYILWGAVALVGSEIIKKIIKDNLPNFHYKAVAERYRKRRLTLKFFIAACSLGFPGILAFFYIKLGQLGILRVSKNSIAFVAAFIIICLVLKKAMKDGRFVVKTQPLLPPGNSENKT